MIGPSTSKWPFIPTCLSDVLEKETLAVIESGSCERLGRPLTILDFDIQTGSFTHRIESVNEKQRYEEFCQYFRDDAQIAGGDRACKAWDINQANISLRDFRKTGEPYRLFRCHAGLVDMSHIVQIRGRPVALIFTGQFLPGDTGMISQSLQDLKNKQPPELIISDDNLENLKNLATKLAPLPDDMRARLEKEALHIQSIAEAEFELRKRQKEQDFLENLRNTTNMLKSIDREQLERKVFTALKKIKEYCSCKYVLFFAGVHENDTVLLPFSQSGLSEKLASDLPHFNWSKAKLPLDSFSVDEQTFSRESQAAIASGIRGNNRDAFSGAACLIPNAMGDRYRSVLVLGPFDEPVKITDERHFLIEIARFISLFTRTGLEVLFLEQERRRWKNRAQLLTHEYKTALTTITTPIGVARTIVQKIGNREAGRADEYLKQAEDRSLLLGRITSGTLEGIAIKVEAEDLEIQNYSLSALVENCATGFMKSAADKNLEIVIEPSINHLPNADIDIPRVTIALENLIENAIKYSFSKSRIFIRSRLNIASGVDLAKAVIEVDNIGFEIPEEDRKRIFEVGERGGDKTRIQRIPGSGFGLWEARSIVEAHGGEIHVKITPTSIHKQEGRASRVVFSIEIPLKQKR
jgi:signal transduction histidine kinase/ligand-binding sensor protein